MVLNVNVLSFGDIHCRSYYNDELDWGIEVYEYEGGERIGSMYGVMLPCNDEDFENEQYDEEDYDNFQNELEDWLIQNWQCHF